MCRKVKTEGTANCKIREILVFAKQKLDFVHLFCLKHFLACFLLADTLPFHQVEIASMQTVSIETLKRQDTWTHSDRQVDLGTEKTG